MIVVIVMAVVIVVYPGHENNSELDGVNDCAGTLSARDNGAPIAHSPGYWVEH